MVYQKKYRRTSVNFGNRKRNGFYYYKRWRRTKQLEILVAKAASLNSNGENF